MLLKVLLLFLVGSLNALIGLIVLLRDPKKLQNRLFFLFSLALAGWVVCIGAFLLSENRSISYFLAKLYYLFPLLVALTMPLFARTFPDNAPMPRRWWLPIILGFCVVALPLWFLPHILLESLVYLPWGKDVILNKASYLVYSLYLLGCLGSGIVYAYLKSRRNKGIMGLQSYSFFVGFLLTSIFGVYFNLILPWFNNYRLIWLGPLFTNAFIIATGYSIIRHKMFDVRTFVVRSVAYILSLVVLASLFGIVVFGTADWLFNLRIGLGVQAYVSFGTAFAALGFGRLKAFFDKVSNSLFYRDAYDTQTLLDNLNRLMVTHVNIEQLLKHAAQAIGENFKSEFCFFDIEQSDQTAERVIGEGTKLLSADQLAHVRTLTPHIHRKVIVGDDLDVKFKQLRDIMQANKIAVLGRLTPNTAINAEGMGYLVLGYRRSGNPYTTKDIRTLEIIVNELVIAIENSLRFEQIQHFNETLQENINEATNKLRRTNEKLQGLDATKDEFITMASHQLRTPLTAVKGYLSMVLEGDAGKLNANQRKLLEQSFTSAQRMVYLIADLLNLSRLSTGKFVIEPVPTDLGEVVQAEIDQLSETARSRQLTLNYERPPKFPELMLDETKIHQVVMNFIDNAIYYTPAGGTIDVELHETANSVEYLVHDSGIGVPKREQHRLFTKFYRADNARQARPDGTGLGLFMAKKVVVGLGGAIIFDSEEGKGSTFGFRFGKRSHAVPSEAAEVSNPGA